MPLLPGFSYVRWEPLVADGTLFLDRWAADAERLGWTTLDLFGVHPVAPAARYDVMGLVPLINGGAVVQLTEATATIERSRLSRLTYRRTKPVGAVPIWEARGDVPITSRGLKTMNDNDLGCETPELRGKILGVVLQAAASTYGKLDAWAFTGVVREKLGLPEEQCGGDIMASIARLVRAGVLQSNRYESADHQTVTFAADTLIWLAPPAMNFIWGQEPKSHPEIRRPQIKRYFSGPH
jgi:hypothetical protein